MNNIRQNITVFTLCHFIFRIANILLYKDAGFFNSIYTPLVISLHTFNTTNILDYQSLLILICLYFKQYILRYLVLLGSINYINDNNLNNIFITLTSLFSNNIDVLFLNTIPYSNYFFIWYLNDIMSNYNYWRLVIIIYILRHECKMNKHILWILMIAIAYYKNVLKI